MSYYLTSPRPQRDYFITALPSSGKFMMKHSHAPSKMVNLIVSGQDFQRYKPQKEIVFVLHYHDIKILEMYEWLAKSQWCSVCEKEIEYRFKLMRPGEIPQIQIRTEVTKANPRGKRLI